MSVRATDRGYCAPAGLTGLARAGQVTALRGLNGAGKSTAVLALLGALTPDQGDVWVHSSDGDVHLQELALESWWTQVAWVPQRPVVEPGTLADYLGPVTGSALAAAAQATGFDEVVAGLSNRWQTRVGQGGIGLSLGQRQRLALTRALAQTAPVLIVDEPTAHLDAQAQRQVIAALRAQASRGRLVVVVAHHEDLLAACDGVLEVRSDGATPGEVAPAAAGGVHGAGGVHATQ